MDITALNHYQSLNQALRQVYEASGTASLLSVAERLKASVDTSGVTPEEVAFVKSYLSSNSSVRQTFDELKSKLEGEVQSVESFMDSGMVLNEAGVIPFIQKTAEGLLGIFFNVLKALASSIGKALEVAFSSKFGKSIGMGVIVLVFVDIATQYMALAQKLHEMGVIGQVLLALYEPTAAAISSLGTTQVYLIAAVLLVLFLVYVVQSFGIGAGGVS